MTLNLNKRFWLCKGLCAVLSLVGFFNAPSWSAFAASTQAMLQDEEMAKYAKNRFFKKMFFILAKRKIYPPALQVSLHYF